MDCAPLPHKQFQFSLCSLFWLTAVLCVVLGTMAALGRTHSFRALGSVDAYLTLLPIAAVWVAWRTRLMPSIRLIVTSFLLYLISMPGPFLNFGAQGRGYQLAIEFTIVTFGLIQANPPITGLFTLGCYAGFLAHASYLIALFLVLCGRPPKVLIAERLMIGFPSVALILSLLMLLSFGLDGELDAIYIGYGVWVAAMLAMWLAVREEVTCASTSEGRTENAADDRSSAIRSQDARD